MQKPKLLWLDDLRNPFLDDEGRVPKGDYEIIWVVCYLQFTQWISKNGLPDLISFDHDLAPEHYTPEKYWNDYEASKDYQEKKALLFQDKTGLDCAKWLVNYCVEKGGSLPEYKIHSANPVGADNIERCLFSYLDTASSYVEERQQLIKNQMPNPKNHPPCHKPIYLKQAK